MLIYYPTPDGMRGRVSGGPIATCRRGETNRSSRGGGGRRVQDRDGLTASAVLCHVCPRAIGQALPDLGPHNHPVASADVFYLVIHWQDLYTADLWEKETLKQDRCCLVPSFFSSFFFFFPPLTCLCGLCQCNAVQYGPVRKNILWQNCLTCNSVMAWLNYTASLAIAVLCECVCVRAVDQSVAHNRALQ